MYEHMVKAIIILVSIMNMTILKAQTHERNSFLLLKNN